ncbi:MAG: arylsulfatase [Planctomycetota bacterium]
MAGFIAATISLPRMCSSATESPVRFLGLVTALFAVTLLHLPEASSSEAPAPPDIVVIMADDLGFADLGSYGGEIDTPHLDRLAAEGLRFSQFRVAPMCVVSRVAMLSGRAYNGGGDQAYSQTTPFPKLLKEAGFATHMTGKWHAGKPNPRNGEVFDNFFGFMGGMTDSFVGGPDWFLNQQRFTDFGPDFYATDALTDTAIEYMRQSQDAGQPTFVFISYNAPHHPCQAPRATVEKYVKRYMAGYQAIQEARVERQREMGLIDADWTPAEPGAEVRRWDDLPRQRQRVEAQRMAAYAATVDEIDQNIGKLLAYLDETGRAENTLVLFISDNGGDYGNGGRLHDAKQIAWKPGGNPSSSNGWAWVKNTPFRSYKHASFDGALASPLIVRWPQGIETADGTIDHTATHITDLDPTILELAGVDYPDRHDGKTLLPLAGSSLVPILEGRSASYEPQPQFSWFEHSRGLLYRDWKAVQLYDGPWQLYNLETDRTETTDLADEEPEKLSELIQLWREQANPALMQRKPALGTQLTQRGWGWHRIQRICKNKLVDLAPDNSKVAEGPVTQLELRFSQPVTFGQNRNKSIRLFAVGNERSPVWELSPTPNHPSHGKRHVVFDDIPNLRPDTAYFVEWDPGWARVGDTPLGPLNDGAYWWRFRTPPASP